MLPYVYLGSKVSSTQIVRDDQFTFCFNLKLMAAATILNRPYKCIPWAVVTRESTSLWRSLHRYLMAVDREIPEQTLKAWKSFLLLT